MEIFESSVFRSDKYVKRYHIQIAEFPPFQVEWIMFLPLLLPKVDICVINLIFRTPYIATFQNVIYT